jgi:hypothetical protein
MFRLPPSVGRHPQPPDSVTINSTTSCNRQIVVTALAARTAR